MPRRPRVDIIISTYNASQFMKQCFEAVRKNTQWPCNVVITDDCSTEKALREYLQGLSDSGQATVLMSDVRRGFAGNNAWAVAQTESPYFCLLNEDTLAQRLWLTHMMQRMRSSRDIGIVGPKLLFPPGKDGWAGTIQHVGIARYPDGAPYHPFRGCRANWPEANVPREVNAVSGACMLIRRRCWDDLGGFDQRYSMGQFEDCDFCWRARERGWRILVQPEAVLYHHEHGCGEETVAEGHDKNRRLLLKEWGHLGSDQYIFGL